MTTSALAGRLLGRIDPNSSTQLAHILRELRPGTADARFDGPVVEVAIGWGDPLDPWQLYLLLVDIIGCHDWGRGEKVAWTCPLLCGDTLVLFEHRKFGLRARLSTDAGAGDPQAVVDGVLRQLEKAWPVVHRTVVQPLLDESVAAGHVSIPNKFEYYLDMFEHLRSRSMSSAHEARTAKPVTTHHGNGTSVSNPSYAFARQSEFEAHAALFAWFALLEHLLVIALAFTDFVPSKGSLTDFLGATWSDKFKQVIDLEVPANKAVYDRLRTLADENRNPAAHGGVDRRATNLDAHLARYGAIPQGVDGKRSAPTYTFRPSLSWNGQVDPGSTAAVPNGWVAIDEVIAWIDTGPLALPALFGRSGLPITFVPEPRRELRRAAARSREDLETLIEHLHYLDDIASNMDW